MQNSKQLLEDFYNDIDDETFLGHEFNGEGEDGSNIYCSSSYTDVDISDKDTNCTSQPFYEENLVPRKHLDDVDEVLYLNNYNILPPQEPIVFHYSDEKGQFVIHWTTIKQGTSVGRAPNQKVTNHKPGPQRQAKQVTDSLVALPIQISNTLKKIKM